MPESKRRSAEISERRFDNSDGKFDRRVWTVVELSSFQLETIKDFRPNVGDLSERHAESYGPIRSFFAITPPQNIVCL